MQRACISMKYFIGTAFILLCMTVWAQQNQPPGEPKTGKTRALEIGGKLLQHNSPLDPMDLYLVGFHPLKHDPALSMEAHHYCKQVNQEFAQCVLFDGNTREANLNGIEYIISERLYETLPTEEKKYWHPHNYEILSGQLIAPGIPAPGEKALMRDKMNSYGKTWHVWDTGSGMRNVDALPLGEAKLAWSFNRDGELPAALLDARDKRLRVDSAQKRRERNDLRPLARPQDGVDALQDAFTAPLQPLPGVQDRRSAPSNR